VRVMEAAAPALVLGSAQPLSDVDAEAAAARGVDVVRRSSGGGAVLVGPGESLWVDIVIPASDRLWDDDVGRAAWWVGELWAAALRRCCPGAEPAVWKRANRRTTWSGRVCFAGVGPGEVLAGGRTVVGVSQRRTRRAALFQTAALLRWRPADLLGLLALEPDERAAGEEELQTLAGPPTEAGWSAPALEEALTGLVMP
jgi:lipoate-protein ligase A